jgi:hypothetical protein
MDTMFTNPTFDELRSLTSAGQLRVVITSDGHTAIGSAARYTHFDLRTGLLPVRTRHLATIPSTTSELLLFRTNDLLVIAPFSKRDYSSAEQQLLGDLTAALDISLA